MSAEAASSPAAVDAEIAAAVERLRPELARLARELFDQPEIGFEEHASVARIAALLAAHGVDAEVGAFGLDTALRATAGADAAASGPHFAIIAEYDALPGIGHACGHNVIAAVAVGAFLAAAPLVAGLGGRLSLIGTPAEENGGGKELIIRAGGFDDVDAAGMVHPSSGSGTSSVLGQRTTGVRRVAVTFHGRAAHAAGAPWLGRNALDAVVTAYQSVAQLRQHILPSDRLHGIITDGGAAPNIVPERASALFYVRSAEVGQLRELTDRVVAVLEGAALATGTGAEIDVDPVPRYLPLQTNTALTARWTEAFAARGHEIPAPAAPPQGGPSTDMGNVSRLVPSIHPSLGLGGPDDVFPHNAAFAELTVLPAAVDALVDAAEALAATAVAYTTDPQLRAAAAAEFAASGGPSRWED
ncbi:p-aminobenzoyl-glutamate hydrolase subunit B [Microbacterium laevaniformans]|uniref:Peptidase M20 domain-containing protein 2 n=1 Tax=Microbacterium laevaniformans TaxID=36807 RepID=A0A150HF66_9MICO|nr:amidohydrolase [Microbacterium laevaniformans]KXZ60260.1 p-aminobenzoyl-glutamate hydrolase subunit B [Microbacterium laevaniformans]